MIDYFIIAAFLGYLIKEMIVSFNKNETINSYAIGNRIFSTFALGSTITATWISGSGFILDLEEFNKDGMKYFLASIGMCLNLTIMSTLLVPKMQIFLGKTSVSSIMNEFYGNTIKNITTILGITTTCGGIAIQFKIMGNVINYLFPTWHLYTCIFLGGILTTLYTCSGGIRSVVRTDIVQAICFSLALIIAIITFDTQNNLLNALNNIPIEYTERFKLQSLLKLTNSELLDLILLTGYFLIPGLKPQVIQRVSMGKDLEQVKKSYFYSSIGLFIVLCLSCYLSYLVFIANPEITGKQILPFLLDMYSIPGTKAVLIIGIIAMCMSTADSNLNISSILIANDFFIFDKKSSLQKVKIARYMTLLIGGISIIWGLREDSLFKFILLSASFYLPIITVPLLGIIFKWTTTSRVCLFTMITCFIFVIIFKFIIPAQIDINFIGIILNAILLITGHYIVEKWQLLKCFGIRSQLKNYDIKTNT
jgi:Na+/proline symporter